MWIACALAGLCLLAEPEGYGGRFEGDGLQMESVGAPRGEYLGRLQYKGESYSFTARDIGDELRGTFRSEGAEFTFTARRDGPLVVLSSGGKTYRLHRASEPATRPSASLRLTRPGRASPGGSLG